MSIDAYTREHTGTCPECNHKGWLSDDHGGLCEDCYNVENPSDDWPQHVQVAFEVISKFEVNGWNTTQLTLNVMQRVARLTKLDIHDDLVANELYGICNRLEDWPEDEGFGSSDSYGYYREAMRRFHIPEECQT